MRPSPPLPHHARYCGDIPTLLGRVGTRRRHDCHCAAYGPLVNGIHESAHYGGQTTNHYAATLEVTPVRAQDAPRRPGGGEDSPGRPSAPWHCSPYLYM
jgi:hypothetical protein